MLPFFDAGYECLEKPYNGPDGTEQFKKAPTSDLRRQGYSGDLMSCWMAMQSLVPTAITGKWEEMLGRSIEEDWMDWPPNDFVFGTMIALADGYVEDHRRELRMNNGDDDGELVSEKARSVRCTQPSTACMPIRNEAEWNPGKRQHEKDVQASLEKVMAEEFRSHYNLRTECVQVQKAHIFGRRMERELEGIWNPATGPDNEGQGKRKRVEEKGKNVEHKHKKVKWADESETPDDLPDYDDDENEGTYLPEVHVGRATVHGVRRLRDEPLPVRLRDKKKERERKTENKEGLPIRVWKPE